MLNQLTEFTSGCIYLIAVQLRMESVSQLRLRLTCQKALSNKPKFRKPNGERLSTNTESVGQATNFSVIKYIYRLGSPDLFERLFG